jgi:glycogen operon protein
MMSLGVPMILMGDEVRRTQNGNNNAYCFDNESNWFDWTLVKKHADVHRFVKLHIARRRLRDVEHEYRRMSLNQLIRDAYKAWHGTKLGRPDWGPNSHSITFTAKVKEEGLLIYMILNVLGTARLELHGTMREKSVAMDWRPRFTERHC